MSQPLSLIPPHSRNLHTSLPTSGLYAITDTRHTGIQLIQAVEQAILGGACLIQYRSKSSDTHQRQTEATQLLALCRAHQVPLLINDDVTLAAQIGAAGVHLGRNDMPLNEARQILGADAIIGVSCYNQWHLAERYAHKADYIAFGRFYSSKTKPQAVPASLTLLQQAQQLPCPVVAIGGINASNGAALITAGANLLAVIDGVFGAPDIRQAASTLSDLWATHAC